jgi:hypothetical protein
MNAERFAHSATLLSGDDVLVSGGFASSLGGYLDSAELYKPSPK